MKEVLRYKEMYFDENMNQRYIFSKENKEQTELSNLEKDKEYIVDIKSLKEEKTHQQRKYFWALIRDIARNPNAPRHDDNELYCWILAKAKVKYCFLQVEEKAIEFLKHQVRAVDVVSSEINKKGNCILTVRAFAGISQFSKEEMSRLIDETVALAEQLGVETETYKRVLKGE